MTLELDWAAAQIEDADSTESTRDDQEESTESTQDEEEIRMDADSTESTRDEEEESTESTQDEEKIRMDADSTDATRDKFAEDIGTIGSKIPSSEIIVRTIAVERAPLVALPADADAAFGQWLANSGLAPSKH